MKGKMLAATAAIMLTAGLLGGCGSLKEDDVIVKVNDTEISVGVANFYARYVQAEYETYYKAYFGDDMWTSEAEEGKTYEETVKDSVMETLEKVVLMEQHMGDYDVSISDKEQEVIDNTADAFEEKNPEEDRDKVMGSKDTVKRVLTLLAVQQKMTDAIEEGADTEVSDEEAAQKSMDYVVFSYEKEESEDTEDEDTGEEETDAVEDTGEMTDEEKAEVKKQAEAFQAKVKKAPDTFSDAASESGLEAETVTFDAESTDPNEDLTAAADALKEGEVTDVVETDDGCYVAVVTSLLDRDATDEKKEEIVEERKNDLLDETLEEWMDAATIDLDKKAWNKIDFTELQVTMKQEEEDTADEEEAAETDESGTAEEETDETGTIEEGTESGTAAEATDGTSDGTEGADDTAGDADAAEEEK